jgi:WhiB family redox-sensing transcriptional regulator
MAHYERTKMPAVCRSAAAGGPKTRFAAESVSPDADWRTRAACRREDPELFFPVGDTGPAAAQIDVAKAVCGRCPVRDECLQWALETGQEAGVWGGLAERERAALKCVGQRSRAEVA